MQHPSEFEKRSLPEEASVPFEMACPHCATTATDKDNCTATSLVSTLLELLIAILFLAGATISYLTSKFTRFFGLQPPCFDRGPTRPESRSNLQKIMLSDGLPTELCALSHSFLHDKHIKKIGACELCSPPTSCSQFHSPTSLERVQRNQLSFTCKRCTPQVVRNLSNCVRRPDPKKRETANYDEATASTDCKGCECSGFGGSIRRRMHRRSTKKMLDSMVLEDCLDLRRGSDDDSIEGAEVESVHQLEREHSLNVFSEVLIDSHSWSQENEGIGFVESSQDFGEGGSVQLHLSGADTRRKVVSSCQGGLQLTGEYSGSPTEPFVPKGEYEGARETIPSSDFCETEEQSVLKAVEPGYVFGNGFDDSNKRTPLLESGNMMQYSTIPGDEVLKNSCSGVDDDSINLKEKLALERETLNRVYLELEKERTASASAADEAMAMITRLQKDKAALQLEAVQYQRMAEGKAMHDEEAIIVLRDFLLKREAEKLCLEKEIEFYRRKFFTSRNESANWREQRDETRDALSWEDDDKDMCPLSESKESEENGHVYGVSLLEPSNPLNGNHLSSRDEQVRQEDAMSIHNSGESSSKTGKDANEEDQSNDIQATGLPCRSYSPKRVNRHEIRPRRKSRGIAERQWRHILERIWSLEEQIHRLKTKHNLNVELSLGAHSGHGMKQEPLKEKRKTFAHKISHGYDSSGKLSVYRRKSGTNEPGKRLIGGHESGDGVSPDYSRTRIQNFSSANGTPAFVSLRSSSLAMDSSDETEKGAQVGSKLTEQIGTLNAFFELDVPLMEVETSKQELSAATLKALLCSSLEPESCVPDERTSEDGFNKDSTFATAGISPSNFRTTMAGRKSQTVLKDEVQEFLSRLQILESDREAMRQIMESMRKNRERMRLLELRVQKLKFLDEREGSAVCDEAPETCEQLLDDPSVEAAKSPAKELCFNTMLESNAHLCSSGEVTAEVANIDARSSADNPFVISNLERHR